VDAMTLTEARALYCLSDKLAVEYPKHWCFQRARVLAYQRWLEACREFRASPTVPPLPARNLAGCGNARASDSSTG
jgi:hypothetical protein